MAPKKRFHDFTCKDHGDTWPTPRFAQSWVRSWPPLLTFKLRSEGSLPPAPYLWHVPYLAARFQWQLIAATGLGPTPKGVYS